MRVLLDRCVPNGFRASLTGHDVSHASEFSWGAVSNGELIRAAAAAGFDVLITVDKSMPHQTPLSESANGVVVIKAQSNRLDKLIPKAYEVLDALNHVTAGSYLIV